MLFRSQRRTTSVVDASQSHLKMLTLAATTDVVRLWLEGPHGCFVGEREPGLVAISSSQEGPLLLDEFQAEPRLAVAVCSTHEVPVGYFENFQEIFEGPFSRLLVIATLDDQVPAQQPGRLVVTFFDVIEELQRWSLFHTEHPVFNRTVTGRMWSLMLSAGYRSPQFPDTQPGESKVRETLRS